MIQISQEQLGQSLQEENPWWDELTGVSPFFRSAQPREFLAEFVTLVEAESPRREVVLLGHRRVGKTFLIHHTIQTLLGRGVPKDRILYAQIDNPVFVGSSLVEILESFKLRRRAERCPG